ncbi:MAG TPA: Ig-like domain-containing protein [Dysgonamonadaceae bacterium]|nr:Ig-like domain-containing protein [Dysgonamonadaceae bacterium]
MLYKLFLAKEKEDALFQKKSKIDFLITTVSVLLLTILGFFMTYKNKDNFIIEMKGSTTKLIATNPTDKNISEISNKTITVTFNKNIDPATVKTTSFILMQGLNFVPGTITPTMFSNRCFYIEILQTADFGFHDFEIGKPVAALLP